MGSGEHRPDFRVDLNKDEKLATL